MMLPRLLVLWTRHLLTQLLGLTVSGRTTNILCIFYPFFNKRVSFYITPLSLSSHPCLDNCVASLRENLGISVEYFPGVLTRQECTYPLPRTLLRYYSGQISSYRVYMDQLTPSSFIPHKLLHTILSLTA